MSQDAFARIASKFTAYTTTVAAIEKYLSKQRIGSVIRLDHAASFVRSTPQLLEAMLDELCNDTLLDQTTIWICMRHDTAVGTGTDVQGRRYCDLCQEWYFERQLQSEQAYSLRIPVVPKMNTADQNAAGEKPPQPMKDLAQRRYARIQPWATLQESQFTIETPTLSDGVKRAALDHLQQFGIARIRFEADVPTSERLETIENWIGPARSQQNDHVGKVKSIEPKAGIAATTGDSVMALGPHVDGTQDNYTPALLGFQYDVGAKWGAESTFMDAAAMLSEINSCDLQRILTSLARRDCSTCTKRKGSWQQTFTGPLVRAEYAGHSVSLRFRPDDLLQVIPECMPEFTLLKNAIDQWYERHAIQFTPREGDIVIFDNWRILHGRRAVSPQSRRQRIHDRIWIDRFHPIHDGSYLLGIRPISPGLMHAIQTANHP